MDVQKDKMGESKIREYQKSSRGNSCQARNCMELKWISINLYIYGISILITGATTGGGGVKVAEAPQDKEKYICESKNESESKI